jgi:hypothetical protein
VLRSGPIWEDNIKIDRKIGCECMDWAELAKVVPNSSFMSTVMNLRDS